MEKRNIKTDVNTAVRVAYDKDKTCVFTLKI